MQASLLGLVDWAHGMLEHLTCTWPHTWLPITCTWPHTWLPIRAQQARPLLHTLPRDPQRRACSLKWRSSEAHYERMPWGPRT